MQVLHSSITEIVNGVVPLALNNLTKRSAEKYGVSKKWNCNNTVKLWLAQQNTWVEKNFWAAH